MIRRVEVGALNSPGQFQNPKGDIQDDWSKQTVGEQALGGAPFSLFLASVVKAHYGAEDACDRAEDRGGQECSLLEDIREKCFVGIENILSYGSAANHDWADDHRCKEEQIEAVCEVSTKRCVCFSDSGIDVFFRRPCFSYGVDVQDWVFSSLTCSYLHLNFLPSDARHKNKLLQKTSFLVTDVDALAIPYRLTDSSLSPERMPNDISIALVAKVLLDLVDHVPAVGRQAHRQPFAAIRRRLRFGGWLGNRCLIGSGVTRRLAFRKSIRHLSPRITHAPRQPTAQRRDSIFVPARPVRRLSYIAHTRA